MPVVIPQACHLNHHQEHHQKNPAQFQHLIQLKQQEMNPQVYHHWNYQMSDLRNPAQIHHQAQVCLYYQDIGRYDHFIFIVPFLKI